MLGSPRSALLIAQRHSNRSSSADMNERSAAADIRSAPRTVGCRPCRAGRGGRAIEDQRHRPAVRPRGRDRRTGQSTAARAGAGRAVTGLASARPGHAGPSTTEVRGRRRISAGPARAWSAPASTPIAPRWPPYMRPPPPRGSPPARRARRWRTGHGRPGPAPQQGSAERPAA